jgi:hypothetical protein
MEHQCSELLDLAVKEWIGADHEPPALLALLRPAFSDATK